MAPLRFSFFAFLTFIAGTVLAGNLKVNLAPQQANNAGARWRVDGGTWRTSGTTVTNLSNAAHTVDYNTVTGWFPPSPVSVTLTNGTTTITGTYAAASSLKVTLTPSSAQWRVDGGAWRNSGTTATGLAPGAHTISYSALADYIAPVTENVTLVAGQTTSLTRDYTATSSLTITLTPSTGSWRIDGGAWQDSGTTASGLTPGAHTINYSALTNYTAPATENVTLVAGQTTSLTRNYTATSSLTITLTPSSGWWQIDGGSWRNSGTTVSGLTPGAHTISYSAVPNHITPPTESVTLVASQTTSLTRTYTETSNLTITLTPSNGSWKVDGGAWQSSGATLALTLGAHTISYDAVANYITPSSETVTLISGQNANLARSYVAASSLTITLTPANASWQLDGGAWQASGTTLSGLTPGAHTISYNAVANYIAPVAESVTLVSGQTTNLTRSYTATSNLTVTLTPSAGLWQLDGVGNWRESGTTATGLSPGNHTITYTGLSAMLSPPAETVTLVSGETTSLARSYTPAGKIFVMLNPNTAQWRVDGGAWRATHTYTEWIAAGSHTIEYSSLPNMLTPMPETVTVVAGETLSISKFYTTESALIVNLTPAVGQWRIDGGAWQDGGTRVGQLTSGNHAVEYSDASGYFAPVAETIFLSSGTDRTIDRSYLRPGAVTVSVVPAEGQWRLNDSGEWQASGATLSGLRPGSYPIQFTSVPGWFDLPTFNAISVAEDQTTTVTYTHVRHATITATLAPGTGQWRVNGGAWQPSGATVGELSSGNYVVDYSIIPGFIPLPSETIALTAGEQKSITRSYSGSSSLTVTLNPSSGTWSVDGGPWRNSGTTASGLPPGAHTISYGTLANHLSPPTETITLGLDEAASRYRSYTPAAQIVVTLIPGTAQWRLDGGEWRASGTSSGLIAAGSHIIGYSSLPNMVTPAPEGVTLSPGQTLLISKTYAAESALTVNLTPAVGQWRIDGGPWQNSGTRVGQLTSGNHTVGYSAVPGYIAPGSETITLNGTDMTITRSYVRFGALTVNVEPAQGQWRLLNGTWRESGATINYLHPGYYPVQFSSVPGYFDLPNYVVFVAEGQTTTVTYTHVRHASITATLTPGAGLWRVNGGVWRSSGATVGALQSGNYVIDYSTIPGFTPLPSETITLAAGEQKSITRSYSENSSLTVTLSPSSGTWSVDGGPWRNSGTTASGLTSGSHTVSYQAVANYLPPPTETITLAPGENASVARSYTPAGQILVTLVPGIAQWRVDGGEWRATGTSSGLIAAGSHTIEYSAVENYIAPPTETVTLAAAQTLAISRTYTADLGATLIVKTIPAYLSEIGVVQWRLDGGNWNPTGAPVSVSSGTHTLEFQPVAGLDVPPASSITISAGATETLEATFYMTHRLRFFLHPDLVAGISPEQLQARLSQYAAHLQTIWHRESLRRFTFNPATDITIVSTTPFSGSGFTPLPEYGFEFWAYADSANGSIYGSNGGFATLDVSGAAGADGMHWAQIYDPSTLAPGSTELFDYWKQIDVLTHEFEHVFGTGLGEYYSAAGFDDATGIAPLYNVDYFAPADPFWNAHTDFWSDPLLRYAWDNYRLGNPNTLPALLDAVHFSGTSRGIINGCYRNADSPGDTRSTLPDLSQIRISVVDANSGQPIPGATLRIWNRANPGPMGGQERTVVATSTPGVFEFHWTADSSFVPLNNWDNGKLLKAFASGYQPKAQWEWIYDAQRVKTVDNSDVWEITVALDPAP